MRIYQQNETGDIYQIVQDVVQLDMLVKQLSQPEDGAVVTFAGIVRNNSLERRTLYLEYEGYEPMALRTMGQIGIEVHERWPINRVGIIHRLGRIEITESSVVIVVTSAHRKVAFEACQYAIDRLKKIVPIWKKEYFEDGSVWVEDQEASRGAEE